MSNIIVRNKPNRLDKKLDFDPRFDGVRSLTKRSASVAIFCGAELLRLRPICDAEQSDTGISFREKCDIELGASRDTVWRWMELADACKDRVPALADVIKQGKPLDKIPERQREIILDAISHEIGDKTQSQLLLEWGKGRGGNNGGNEERKKPTAAEQREAADQAVNSWADNIKAWSVDTAAIPLCSRLTLQNLAEAALQLRKSIEATLEEKKSK